MPIQISHCPTACGAALASTRAPIIIDIETTGLGYDIDIVSVGVLVETPPGLTAFVLFTPQSLASSVAPYRITLSQIVAAMQQAADGKILVLHNSTYDLTHLLKAGFRVGTSEVWCTFRMLKLVDPDRGWESDDAIRSGRSTSSPARKTSYEEELSYRLKDLARHVLRVQPKYFQGLMSHVPYQQHVDYLVSDLRLTRKLYNHIRRSMTDQQVEYYRRYTAPVQPILAGMTVDGVRVDVPYANRRIQWLTRLATKISRASMSQYGFNVACNITALHQFLKANHPDVLSAAGIAWKKWLVEKDIDLLMGHSAVAGLLALRADYRLTRSMISKFQSLLNGRCGDGRLHPGWSDKQATGRISCTEPNLQQIPKTVAAKKKLSFVSQQFQRTKIRVRNAIQADAGHLLVGFDISQADVRCLAETLRRAGSTARILAAARANSCTSANAQTLRRSLKQFIHNPAARKSLDDFTGFAASRLAKDFIADKEDFYKVAARRMLGRKPKDDSERDRMKQTILSIVNGMAASSLAKRLKVSVPEAKGYIEALFRAYPELKAFIDVMHMAIARTGVATSIFGRERRITPHRWMVSEPQLQVLVGYVSGEHVLATIQPIVAGRFALIALIIEVEDVGYKSPRRGTWCYRGAGAYRTQHYYQFLDDAQLTFKLPVRGIPWRFIRQVHLPDESATYQGFDRVKNQLFNHIAQSATADVSKLMMLRMQPVLKYYGAKLLLQIHDELVFQVPEPRVKEFWRVARRVLELPPLPGWRVPMRVEPKIGSRLGNLRKFSNPRLPST